MVNWKRLFQNALMTKWNLEVQKIEDTPYNNPGCFHHLRNSHRKAPGGIRRGA